MKVVGVIPARGGSKRVKLKNIKPLGGRPLIEYTIKTALDANLDRVLVSTDHPKIAEISKLCGAEVIKRPKEIAEDVDSIPRYSPVIIRDLMDNSIDIKPIEEIWYFANAGYPPSYRDSGKRQIRSWTTPKIQIYVGHVAKQGSSFTKITSVSRHRYKGSLVRINTVGGLIDVTPNHSVINSRGKVVDASHISEGEELAQPRLQVGCYKECDEFIGDTDLAWLLGFFVAEGSLTYLKSNNSYMISFSNKDEGKLKNVKRIFSKYFHTSMRISQGSNCLRAVSSCRKAFHFFKSCYTGRKEKRVPKIILNARKKIKRSFLDGYNDGDGATTPQKKWHSGRYKRFGAISQTLCLGLLLLIIQITGQTFSIHCRDDKPNFIQMIFNSGEKPRWKNPRTVKKIREINYDGWVYDIETKFNQFCTGVGTIRAHNTTLVLTHVIETLEREGEKIKAVVTLQPTSPFRDTIDVDLALGAFNCQPLNPYRKTVLTVTEVNQLPQWMLKKKYGNARYVFHTEPLAAFHWTGDNLVSQTFPTLYYPNGAVYVSDRDLIMKAGRMFTEECIAVLMPDDRSIDLETLWDFEVAEALLKAGVIK